MQHFILLSTIVYALLLASLATLQGRVMALAIPFVLYLLYGFYRSAEVPRLSIERKLSSERVAPGSDIEVTLVVKNEGLDIEELYLEDQLSHRLFLRSGSNRHLIRLPAKRSYTITYTLAGPRGAYEFGSILV